ncbi:F0F1 ATP synthase subunit A [Kyrpidia tusciae]|uniref:ATP synthase subunit a n=1 Tax=Kyrpidia tusciae (strain DSM 2912 / NBRC 15312 / T2) TaxID=562970 RepID=D5WX66_KYRT2|nr:F0F1 ATP synthase subunit A [Kyrpidia tusciae]ADG07847.1 ATP synthase F0, A subunit [Kyrpidia tusciae DSM 2912]
MEGAHPILVLWGMKFNLATIGMSLLMMIIVAVLARMGTSRMSMRSPRGMQNVLEWLYGFVRGLATDMMSEKQADKFVPLALTLIIYIFISNMSDMPFNITTAHPNGIPELGVEPGQSVNWWVAPTANMSVTMAMSLMVILLSHYLGLRRPGAYFKHYFEPFFIFLPINILEEVAKFLTLGLRLYGNIFAGEVLISVLLGIPMAFGWLPIGNVPTLIIWIAYSIFVGTIQSFVFTVLTLVYISQKLPHEAH